MLNSFLIVGMQVAILFILIALGFLGGKIKYITEAGVKSINDIMLYFVTPCVVINAFQREFDKVLLNKLIVTMGAALIAHIIPCLLGILFIKTKEDAVRKVYRFATVFSNSGFMALPLLDALLGSEGVFYGAGYLGVFNICAWSFGQYYMSKGTAEFEVKKAIINPGVISIIIGLFFFFNSISLPEIILSPIKYLAGLNTPLPMLLIGYMISTLEFKDIVTIKEEAIPIVLRLIVSPLLVLFILYMLGLRGTMLVSTIVSTSAPIAAMTTMFAIKFDCDAKKAAKLVAVSTLFSIFTMTLIVGFTQYIA